MKTVYVEGGDFATSNMFEQAGWMEVDDPHAADLICFTGGADVSPTLYGETNTGESHTNVNRDLHCTYLWNIANNFGIPTVGICRGGQFLNVMNGGTMEQHINGHGMDHAVFINNPNFPAHMQEFHATSTHHQHMVPDLTGIVEDVHGIAQDGVNEILLYEDSLCFQPHPEYSGAEECREVFFYLIDRYLMGDDVA